MMNSNKKIKVRRYTVTAILLALIGVSTLAFQRSVRSDDYGDGFDNSLYNAGAFAGKTVMVIVPHQDDELNLAGSTMHLLIQGGADVRVVFSTNGDYRGLAEVRLQEAARALSVIGIPKENLIFLGYGDGWKDETYPLYNHEPNEPAISYAGRTETYGASGFPDYRTSVSGSPSLYTLNNFLNDLRDVIISCRPDVLICIDLDEHTDHRALSLTFDRVMGQILSSQNDYQPTVLKGFTYDTAWYAPLDYYAHSIPSTQMPAEYRLNDARYTTDSPPYRFTDRIRIPLPADMLAYTMHANRLYTALGAYASQMGALRMEMAASGDQVFWKRNTNSILYRNATISASSGNIQYLTDFMLLDSHDIGSSVMTFSDCLWTPGAADPQKSVTVSFDQPVSINAVSLYDNCSLDDNILSGELRFSDGSTVTVDPLIACGTETRVAFEEKQNIRSFTFTITEYEGQHPGLSEIEAFEGPSEFDLPAILKIIHKNSGDFLYRYWAEPGETIPLSAYLYPKQDADVIFRLVDGENDSVSLSGQTVSLAENAHPGTYRVRAELASDASVYDEIEIWIPTRMEALRWQLDTLYERICNKTVKKMFVTWRSDFIHSQYGS